jgi:restriction endonuclease S subunit
MNRPAGTFDSIPNVDWLRATLGDDIELISGVHIDAADYHGGPDGIPYITGPSDFANGVIRKTKFTDAPAVFCEPGDILLTVKGSGTGSLMRADSRYCISRQLMAIRTRTWCQDFIYYVLSAHSTEYQAAATGLIPGITREHVLGTVLRVPPHAEQETIAAVLSAWDRAIGQTAGLITAKERLKQGLMQQLLTGKRRFPEFRHHKTQPTRLDAVLKKVSKPVIVEPSTSYREIGIRSHGKGIFHKEPVEGHGLGNKRVYEVVPGCLTLNIVFAWERALAVTTNREAGMIASHRFPMFQPDPKRVAVDFVLHFMLSDVGHNTLKLASPGGAGRNRTISQEQFLKTIVPLPSVAEQRKIIAFINAAENEITILRRHLQALKKQKRGLMQQLLTGRVRVPKSLLRKEAKS